MTNKKNKDNENNAPTDFIQDLENIHKEEGMDIYEKIGKIHKSIESKYATGFPNTVRDKKIHNLLKEQFGQKRMLLLLMIDPKPSESKLQYENLQSLCKTLSDDLKISLCSKIPCDATGTHEEPRVKTVAIIIKNILDEKKADSEYTDSLVTWLRKGGTDDRELKTPLDRIIACYAYAQSYNYEKRYCRD